MSPLVDPSRRRRALTAVVAAAALAAAGCTGDSPTASGRDDPGPNEAPPETLAGGVQLPAVDPARLLVGDGLAYGEPLPSQQAAADAYLEDPEVAAVVARRLYSRLDGRLVAEVLVLALDGDEIFDAVVLDAFVVASVGALGDGAAAAVDLAGRSVLRSRGPAGTVIGYREGDQLMLVRGVDDRDVGVVVERQLRAVAAGAPAPTEAVTPLVAVPIDAAFVPVPTLTFQPIPLPEEEPPPPAPALVGATAVQGRYGVVAGERRSTVWAYSLDLVGTYPSAERVEPALAALVAERAGGAGAERVEVLGRIVLRADGRDGAPSARAFRHQGIVLLVEGQVPAQLDAVITAWLTALG